MDENWMFYTHPIGGAVLSVSEAAPVVRYVADDDAPGNGYGAIGWAYLPGGVLVGTATQFITVAGPPEHSESPPAPAFNDLLHASQGDLDAWDRSPTPSTASTNMQSSPSPDPPRVMQPEAVDFDRRLDPSRYSLEGSVSPKTKRALRHATPDNFAKQASNIWELYLGKRNYKLKDVIPIMVERHGFFATQKMYKNHFKKWGWGKYKQPEQGNKPACQRHSPSQELRSLENEVTKLLVQAARGFSDLLEMCVAQDPEWSQRSRFEPAGLQYGLSTQIAAGVNLIHENETWSSYSGGDELREGFVMAEHLLSDLDLGGGIDLILWTPGELLALESSPATDILHRYLRHLEDYSRQSRKLSTCHPIGSLIQAMRQLAQLGNDELRAFVSKGTEVLTSLTGRRVDDGGIDRTHVDAMSFSLFLELRMGQKKLKDLRNVYDWSAQQLVRSRKDLIEYAERDRQPGDTLLRLQDDLLGFQDNVDSIFDFTSADFVEQSEALMRTLSNHYGEGSFAQGARGWSPLHRSIYAARVMELARHFFCTDQPYRALSLLPNIMIIPRLDLKTFLHIYNGLFLFIIDQLRRPEFGLVSQASELANRLQAHQGVVLETDVTENFQTLAIVVPPPATLCSIPA